MVVGIGEILLVITGRFLVVRLSRRNGQALVVAEDPQLQVAQRGSRSKTRRLDEMIGVCSILRQRIRLASGAIESDHQSGAEALVQRMLDHERLELADDVSLADREVGIDSRDEGTEPLGVEAGDLATGPRGPVELLVRMSPPQRECGGELLSPAAELVAPERSVAERGEVVELVGVELILTIASA